MVLKEWMNANAKLSIILLSFLVTLAMTFITKKFTNQTRMKELKELQKEHQKKLKENKGNPDLMMKIQKEMLEGSLELMKHSFKPMLITLLPLLILFWWIKGIYSGVLNYWIWYYIGASIISSIILRKIFKVV